VVSADAVAETLYEKIWADGEACEGCRYLDCQTEPHGERLCDCTVKKTSWCPGLQQLIEQLYLEI
jgi:hypothetical protein